MREHLEYWLEGMRLRWQQPLFPQPAMPSSHHSVWSVMRGSFACDTPTMPLYPSTRRSPRIAETLAPPIFPARDPLAWARRLRPARWQKAVSPHLCEVANSPSGLLCIPMTGGFRTRLKGNLWGTYKYFRLLRSDRVTRTRKKRKEVNAFHRAAAPARHSRYGFAPLQQSTTSEVKTVWRSS